MTAAVELDQMMECWHSAHFRQAAPLMPSLRKASLREPSGRFRRTPWM